MGNCVRKIQSLMNPHHWNRCPGHQSPTDDVSCGVTAKKLVTSEIWAKEPVGLMT